MNGKCITVAAGMEGIGGIKSEIEGHSPPHERENATLPETVLLVGRSQVGAIAKDIADLCSGGL
jgi:hypothetical protein